MNSPRSILSPRWSGFFILTGTGGSAAFRISFGGSGFELLTARGRPPPCVNGLPEENEGERLDLSRSASDQLKPSPPVAEPGLEPIFTSRIACAPKLTLLAKDGEGGCPIACGDASSSSMTAGSSPKLFLNSGELDAEDVAMLARR